MLDTPSRVHQEITRLLPAGWNGKNVSCTIIITSHASECICMCMCECVCACAYEAYLRIATATWLLAQTRARQTSSVYASHLHEPLTNEKDNKRKKFNRTPHPVKTFQVCYMTCSNFSCTLAVPHSTFTCTCTWNEPRLEGQVAIIIVLQFTQHQITSLNLFFLTQWEKFRYMKIGSTLGSNTLNSI